MDFFRYSLENGNTIFHWFSVRLSHKLIRLKSCQLLNITTQLENTNLGQPTTKKCLNLFSLWCKRLH